ncbi:MAG: hypothetical protein ABW123_06150 [Cystobacter sp.]
MTPSAQKAYADVVVEYQKENAALLARVAELEGQVQQARQTTSVVITNAADKLETQLRVIRGDLIELEARMEVWRDHAKAARQQIHQAYHHGSIETCTLNACTTLGLILQDT